MTPPVTIRWATVDDIDKIAQFNKQIHEEPGEEDMIYYWTRDLMSGHHPTTTASDFTIVEDEAGEVVSTLCLISQTWSYDGIPFKVGQPELVGTLEPFRRRGLVRKQMEMVHARSAERGELMQGITGIPWYYRQFGYDMALDLGGGRIYDWGKRPPASLADGEEEQFQRRTATIDDIPLLQQLQANNEAHNLISIVRPERLWRHGLTGHDPRSLKVVGHFIYSTTEGKPVAYTRHQIWGDRLVLSEVGIVDEQPIRPFIQYLVREMKGFAEQFNKANEGKKKTVRLLYFRLGQYHPIYDALDAELDPPLTPYAWYIRIPDLPAFLTHIKPVLEKRLANSVMAKHTGTLKLNFYRSNLALEFNDGSLANIGPYKAQRVGDGHANFPDLLFYQLLCGRLSLPDIQKVHVDCYTNNEAKLLLRILFPKRSSNMQGID